MAERTDKDRVRAAYPSARIERRGFTSIIMAWITEPNGKRFDKFLGLGRNDAAAWADAAERELDDG